MKTSFHSNKIGSSSLQLRHNSKILDLMSFFFTILSFMWINLYTLFCLSGQRKSVLVNLIIVISKRNFKKESSTSPKILHWINVIRLIKAQICRKLQIKVIFSRKRFCSREALISLSVVAYGLSRHCKWIEKNASMNLFRLFAYSKEYRAWMTCPLRILHQVYAIHSVYTS